MKDTPYFAIFGDVYSLMKEHYPAVNEDDYWERLLYDANNVCEKHQSGEFVKAMVIAVLKELERRAKQ